MSQLRKDPVTFIWVIFSREKGRKPIVTRFSQKDKEEPCPFCPGYERFTPPEIYSVREKDTNNWLLRVVPNRMPVLKIEGEIERRGVGLYDAMNAIGAHEVVIETPDHNRRFHQMTIDEIKIVIEAYRFRMEDLLKDERFQYISIFKNEGPEAGSLIYHSHSQIIATPVIPINVREKLRGSLRYYDYKERCIYCDIITQERDQRERIVTENGDFITIAPFASRFPFEVVIYPKRHSPDFYKITDSEIESLARILKETLLRLSHTLEDLQYNLIITTAPSRRKRRGYWQTLDEDFHWHIEIIPRILKMAGFQWATGFYINPTYPEEAAEFLRNIDLEECEK